MITLCWLALFGAITIGLIYTIAIADTHYKSTQVILKVLNRKPMLYKQSESEKECSICCEDFIENEQLSITVCAHIYHEPCINSWIEQAPSVSCPVCRYYDTADIYYTYTPF